MHCYSSDDIFDKVKESLQTKIQPTVIFSTNFYLTKKTINVLNRLKMHIPEDISLLAFDNVDAYSIYNTKLTIASQLPIKLSEASVDIILKRVEGFDAPKRVVKLGIEILEGDSVKNFS